MLNVVSLDMDQLRSPQEISDAIGKIIFNFGLENMLNSGDTYEFRFINKLGCGPNYRLLVSQPPHEEKAT